MKDAYETLGVSPVATQKEIKAAYRKLAQRYHPDRHKCADTAQANEQMFKDVEAAYRVLKDPVTRAHYDTTGSVDMPSSAKMAKSMLIKLFRKHVEKAVVDSMVVEEMQGMQVGFVPDTKASGFAHILPAVRLDLTTGRDLLERTLSLLERSVKQLTKYRRSITCTDPTNIFSQVVEAKLKQAAEQLAGAGVELVAYEAALQELGDYAYDGSATSADIVAGILNAPA